MSTTGHTDIVMVQDEAEQSRAIARGVRCLVFRFFVTKKKKPKKKKQVQDGGVRAGPAAHSVKGGAEGVPASRSMHARFSGVRCDNAEAGTGVRRVVSSKTIFLL